MHPQIHTYSDARAYLTERLDYETRPDARPYTSTHYSLQRFVRLLDRMGKPHEQFRSVHIAGSKGKGSVAALLESGLFAAGRRTGTYVSPHLRDYPERIRLQGQPIAEEEFARVMAFVAPIVEQDGFSEGDAPPYRTVFELLTALAFEIFRREKVDLAVLETGLGGRLDCTNVVLPEVAVITPLGLDHTDLLGSTLDKIAWEKGGIIKNGVPVVVAAQSPEARVEALPILERIAQDRRAPFHRADLLFDVEPVSASESGQTLRLRARPEGRKALPLPDVLEIRLALAGTYQPVNVRTSAAAWAALRQRGWDLSWEAFVQGAERCRWPGRMEILPTNPRMVVDGAHCPLSCEAVAETLEALYPGVPRHVVFGCQRDKNIRGMIEALISRPPRPTNSTGPEPIEEALTRDPNLVKSWSFYRIPGGRGASADKLAAEAGAAGISEDRILTYSTAGKALQGALNQAGAGDVVVSCGTLYTVSEVLDMARRLLGSGNSFS